MATATSNNPADNSSLANFKQWAQAISNAFGTTCGWTQTADTGQVNWGTIASVPSSTYVYEIWKQADALASSLQIFVKMEYGFSSTQPSIRVTVGTSSNGSGTITGVIAFNALVICNSNGPFNNQGAGALPCFFSGDAAEFRMLMWGTSTVTGVTCFFAVERSKDGNGANTADYVTVFMVNSGSSTGARNRQQTITSGGLVTIAETVLIGTLPTNTTFNGTTPSFPVFPNVGKLGNPCLGLASCLGTDVADVTTVTIASMYGSTHTYVSAKSNVGGTGNGFARVGALAENNPVSALLMRYE